MFLNIGLRYEHSSGFVAGLDLPLYAVMWDYVTPRLGAFYDGSFRFPFSLIFSQLYVGYAWSF